jgi:hypothetical protein
MTSSRTLERRGVAVNRGAKFRPKPRIGIAIEFT